MRKSDARDMDCSSLKRDVTCDVKRLRRQMHQAWVGDTIILAAIASVPVIVLTTILTTGWTIWAGIFVLVGFTIVAICRQPSLLRAAARFDAAHDTDDLVSTALMTPARDEWSAVVCELARAKLQTLPAPAFAVFNTRTRAAVLMLATAVWIGASLAVAPAREADELSVVDRVIDSSTELTARTQSLPSVLRVAQRDPESAAANDISSNESSESLAATDRARSGESTGTGAGQADANGSQSATLSPEASHREQLDIGSRTTGRGIGSAAGDSGTADVKGEVNRAGNKSRPWDATDWSQRATTAVEQANVRILTSDYRAIVRDYFDR